MSNKLQRALEEKLLIGKNIETKIENLMQVDYDDISNLEKITLNSIIKQRFRMVGRYDA